MLRHDATFRHPALSLWQAALHETLARRAGLAGMPGEGLHLSAEHEAMRATHAAAREALQPGLPQPPAPHPDGLPLRREALQCARLFVQLALAHARRDAAGVALLRSEVRYLSCDPLWLEALVAYERALERGGPPAYVRHRQLSDFVLDGVLPDPARVALLADWGTGMPDAEGLLEQVAQARPDVVLHLGDIYYAGTPHEVRAHFLDLFARAFPQGRPPVFALAGNHDRYSGGEGYRQLLAALGQPASYFCLRNAHWQLLALDTGLHDPSPREAGHTLTTLERSELAWHRDKLLNAGGRRSVLLSHHPYLSFSGVGQDAEGRSVAVNPHLRAGLGELLERVALWLWGHEHDLLVFAPYAGLARGRCIGAGAVPRLVHPQRRSPLPGLRLPEGERAPPSVLPHTRLSDDGLLDFHAWALLELQGAAATVSYFQAPCRELRPGRTPPRTAPLFTEHLPAREGPRLPPPAEKGGEFAVEDRTV
ncbi:metallophosphoesterase [Aggregicoccus sp. 17bor-14]|uniref:metallophosphoesterase family protein n=1 Tax=Myxococcaceae TaxID=31 RepID=UPI00129C7948|nr:MULTISPECIES: metallophosphoesterase [Myxococcaceae]MBF5045836.1 metallophosphoesterase [Simulacricoccus sp. 17bor-14]MRI91570.1 metallophosphoesterase [Aggregicoccus sp. 17bor-14]